MAGSIHSILNFNTNLLPNMVDIKYNLMSKNIYSFYRGTCHLFYEDLCKVKKIPASPLTWLCGDLHIENFGSFKGDNRLTYFDLNDFDEAILAPAVFELIRCVTSIFIGFESLGIENKKAVNMANLFLKTYCEILIKGKCNYIEPKTATGIVADFLKHVNKRKRKTLLNKRTQKINNTRKIRITEKHIELDKRLRNELSAHISNWIVNHNGILYNYEVIDAVFRVAGLGSLGLKRYLFLLKSTNRQEKYLLVDMKQAKNSSLEPVVKSLNIPQPKWNTEAERIIAVQQRMQNVHPAMLSATVFKGEHYIIQEMQTAKEGINLNLIKHDYRHIYRVISDMAILTASAQLRSSGRQNSATCDELIQFGQRNDRQQFILDHAVKYRDKVKKDFTLFTSHINSKSC